MKRLLFLSVALAGGVAVAQAPVRPEPADAKAAAKDRPYESAFKDYRPYVDPQIAPWREANEGVGRLGGHMGHTPQERSPAPKGDAKAKSGGHGGHK